MKPHEIINLISEYGKLQYEMAAWWVLNYSTHKEKERERRGIFEKISIELGKLDEERKDLLELIHDLFSQGCYLKEGDGKSMYDHSCTSVYEEAQRLLMKEDLIKKEQCYRE